MEIRKSDLLKKEVRERYLANKPMYYKDFGDKYQLDPDVVKEIVSKEIKAVIQEKKDAERITAEAGELIDKEGNINSKETLAFLHEHSKKLIENAIENGDYGVALSAMNTLSKQVELSMKKLGELNKKDDERNVVPTDFIDFLIKNIGGDIGDTNEQRGNNTELFEEDTRDELQGN